MRTLVFTLLIVVGWSVHAQKVAVVMSGGAAKGMAHIGMLKALEENEIPIDYVVGTSMGGIIAGCYAAGMSPDQIEETMLKDNLQSCLRSGSIRNAHPFRHAIPWVTKEPRCL